MIPRGSSDRRGGGAVGRVVIVIAECGGDGGCKDGGTGMACFKSYEA